MKTKNKNLWFKIEAIPRCNYFMTVPVVKYYGDVVSKLGGGDYFKNVMWIVDNEISYLCYKRKDFDKGVNFLFNKAIENPGWLNKANNEIIKYTRKYYSHAKTLENKNFGRLNNKQLADAFVKLIEFQRKSHACGQMSTWLIDAEYNLFSNYLSDLTIDKLKNIKSRDIDSAAFSLLTTPEKPSYINQEETDSLSIALEIFKDKKIKDLFLKNNTEIIIEKLNGLPRLKSKIYNHHKKYLWLHYTYEGPVLELEYFIEIWKGLVNQGDLKKLFTERKNKFKIIKNEREKLFKKLKFTGKEKHLINIAKDIIWIKGWRKDCMYFGSYILDKIALEIGKRLGLSLKQVRYFCDWEITDALLKNKFDPDELNQRKKFSLIISKSDGKPKIYYGAKAKQMMAKLDIEEEKVIEVDELTGTSAYPGMAKGAVKIIETTEDIKKMNKGDILLSETTYPALVPAMKLASAIVTNVGGITCHAAIVSRELKIPCVVGTKIATKVLKDGDMVEVDANKGIVKILNE